MVLTARNAEATIARALDSVLNQSLRELQLVIAGFDCTDRTLDMCKRVAERDIRVDVVAVADNDELSARDCGVALARGTYLVFMDGESWLAPGMLEALVGAAEERALEFALPSRLLDDYDSQGVCTSLAVEPTIAACTDDGSIHDALIDLVESDALEMVGGALYLRERVQASGILFGTLSGDLEFNALYLKDTKRIGGVAEAAYHVLDPSCIREFVPYLFDRYSAEQESLTALLSPADMQDRSAEADLVADKRFYRRLVACIENVCLAPKAPAAKERNARVRAMVNAPKTVDTTTALKPCAHELGFMYNAIARKSIAACCMGAWVSNLMRTTQRMSLRM